MALKYQTIYDPLPVQSYIIKTVKEPILNSVEVIFDPNTSKIQKLRAAASLWRALQAMSHLPSPTIENTWHPNGHNLIRIRDWLLERLILSKQRRGLIEKVFNLVVIIINFDPPWRWIIDSAKDKALQMEWKPRGYGDDWSDSYTWWAGDEEIIDKGGKS